MIRRLDSDSRPEPKARSRSVSSLRRLPSPVSTSVTACSRLSASRHEFSRKVSHVLTRTATSVASPRPYDAEHFRRQFYIRNMADVRSDDINKDSSKELYFRLPPGVRVTNDRSQYTIPFKLVPIE